MKPLAREGDLVRCQVLNGAHVEGRVTQIRVDGAVLVDIGGTGVLVFDPWDVRIIRPAGE